MSFIELLKVILLGIVEGITEWLPISSTGHMILVNEFIQLNVDENFMELFLVVIQLGAILAVVVLFWEKIFPFHLKNGFKVDKKKMNMWFKIVVASLPAAIIGIPFDDVIDRVFYNYVVVAAMLIIYGVFFIVIENRNKGTKPRVQTLDQIDYKMAFLIGIFQLLAVIPGTSRSGATIVGSMMIGISRTVAAEFTFFLAIPAMAGASLIKILKIGLSFPPSYLALLIVGMVVAFVVSVLSIRFLMGYIKKHDFKVFGWYRIVLGILVLGYFILS